MKNKVNLKKCLMQCMVVVVFFQILFVVVQWKEHRNYSENYNQALCAVLQKVQETYPDVNEVELVAILNSEEISSAEMENFAKEYGIDLEKESVLLKNDKVFSTELVINGIILFLFAVGILIVFLHYNHKKDQELMQITHYIEQINQRNYRLDIDNISEDELSILKNEIYKTTVMLKETAENSLKAKNDLKDSLSDISHQLKTPLTSITVMLDNLLDNSNMDVKTRQGFVMAIKREIRNVNFLVQSLLKLSKLDADAVVFLKEKVDMRQIVEAAVQNLEALCDLKNVTIEMSGEGGELHCDFRWQVEAITNVLKNCVEYSPENCKVIVQMQNNQVYSSLSICDFGPGMDEEDQKHIFERFYKGKNATSESVGIGLALAKAIVEVDHGHISVHSDLNGTEFTIKYFHM